MSFRALYFNHFSQKNLKSDKMLLNLDKLEYNKYK